MIIDDLDKLFFVFLVTLLFLSLYYFAYRKFLFSIFDPLFIFLLTMSFTSTLIVSIVAEPKYIFLFFLSQLMFWIGFSSVSKWSISHISNNEFKVNPRSKHILQIITYISFLVFLISNLYMINEAGLTLLQDNPSIAKVASFSGGLGFVRRINWGLGNFLAVSTIVCLFISKRKLPFLLILIIHMGFTMLNGSKSGLISFLTIFILISFIKGLDTNKAVKNSKKFVPIMLVMSIGIGIFILFRQSNSLEEASFGFATRLLYSGDVAFYYYTPDILRFYKSFGFSNYILHELNPILGMFRLTEYAEPLGSQMLNLSLSKYIDFGAVIGPNTPFYVKGHIFFGDYGTGFYGLISGGLIGYFRYKFLIIDSSKLVLKVFLLSISNIIFLYATESNLLIGQIFDTIFFLTPIVLISLIIYECLYSKIELNLT